MKLKLLMLSLLSTLLFVACGEGEEPDGPLTPPQGVSVAIAEIKADIQSATVKISHSAATKYAYIVDKASLASYKDIEKYVEDSGLGECDAEIEIGE
jgi:hypothetical protein